MRAHLHTHTLYISIYQQMCVYLGINLSHLINLKE